MALAPLSGSVAVVGAGWAGLAAAVAGTESGQRVTLFEMASQAGGRARAVPSGDHTLDNGQHIAIGAYSATLAFIAKLGLAEGDVFVRTPLRLVDARGDGLRLPAGRPTVAFARAVLGRRGWRFADRLALLRLASRWMRAGFSCDAGETVADLARSLPVAVRNQFIEPLCVAALNTPADEASGTVFLRVLHDALASGHGSADLLLPRVDLGAIVPAPALAWLAAHGADIRLTKRVARIEPAADGWQVDGESFDRVVLASSAAEAARLTASLDAGWSSAARDLRYEPIVTVYAMGEYARLPEAMLLLASDEARPAQFVFDRGGLGGPAGLLAFVVSGAGSWLARGTEAIEAATLAQAEAELGGFLHGPLRIVRTIVEKRATFRCTPGLKRPPARIVAGLVAAGDYVDGPYPATLEGALRSGIAAAHLA